MYMIAVDSSYPLSLKVMKHYERPTLQMHHTFNRKLNGLRTVSSENVYGRLKQRFPILQQLRMDLALLCWRVVFFTTWLNTLRMMSLLEVESQLIYLMMLTTMTMRRRTIMMMEGMLRWSGLGRIEIDTYANNFYQAYLREGGSPEFLNE